MCSSDLLPDAVIAALEERGHQVRRLDAPYGNMQAVEWDRVSGAVRAASDPRGIGLGSVTAD